MTHGRNVLKGFLRKVNDSLLSSLVQIQKPLCLSCVEEKVAEGQYLAQLCHLEAHLVACFAASWGTIQQRPSEISFCLRVYR